MYALGHESTDYSIISTWSGLVFYPMDRVEILILVFTCFYNHPHYISLGEEGYESNHKTIIIYEGRGICLRDPG